MSNNIHILPTNKPSRLCIDYHDNLCLSESDLLYVLNREFKTFPQNIYITSDIDIQKEDWFMDTEEGEVFKAGENVDLHLVNVLVPHYKKIILTTDRDLIEDSEVQAIDDEFLEWLVKNPSCDEVEVIDHAKRLLFLEEYVPTYKIIIPKEEPNFSNSLDKTLTTISLANSMFGLEDSKQETLEEAGERLYPNRKEFLSRLQDIERKAFVNGAKWQQERNYNEEDLLDLIQFLALNETFDYDSVTRETAKLFLNQFKKSKTNE